MTKFKQIMLLVVCCASWAANAQDKPTAVVSVTPVQQMTIAPTLMVSGQVYSKFQSNLSSGIDGRLDWVVEAGQQVRQGDLLARMDQQPLKLQINEVQAQLKRAQIQAAQLQNEAKRQTALLARSLVSKNQVEQARAAADLANADIELATATLAQLQDQLTRTELKAPFNGVVSQTFHQLGEELTRSTPLLQLVDLDRLEVRVFAPLQYAAFVQTGAALQVFQPSGQQKLAVSSIIPLSDNRSQTFELRLNAKATEFQVGQLVSVAVPTAAATASLVIHRDALVLAKQQHSVFRLKAKSSEQSDTQIAEKITVQTGQGQGEWLQVDAPLQVGDLLVVRGAETLNDGDAVRVLSDNQFKLAGAERAVK